MQTLRFSRYLLALAIGLSGALCWAVAERGWFGFGLNVESEGMFWNPTLVSLFVSDVAPGSPALAAGLVAGDQILEVEGTPVAGRKGKEFRAVLEGKGPGDTLRLLLKHANGTRTAATLVAARKPGVSAP